MSKRPFQAIAAMSLNRVIGKDGQLPWHLPEDFKWFKAQTMGHILVMGRKTFESIGRPLSGRTTIILSKSGFNHPGVETVTSLEAIKQVEGKKVFICGGAEIYKQALPLCSDLYLTIVNRQVDGNVFFPFFEPFFQRPRVVQEMPEFSIFHFQEPDESVKASGSIP